VPEVGKNAPAFTLADQHGDKLRLSSFKGRSGKKFMGIQRSAFLVDENGRIATAWPKIFPKDTPTNLLTALGS